MKRILFTIAALVAASSLCQAQRVVAANVGGYTYAAVDCSGMPAGSVKSAAEVAASKTATGRVVRHQPNVGNGSNMNVNEKLSPKFAVAPQNTHQTGNPDNTATQSWAMAIGYTDAVNTDLNATGVDQARGCAMYAGLSGTDPVGTWRLPTQRELQVMYMLRDRFVQVVPTFTTFTASYYWSASELSTTSSWCVVFTNGTTFNNTKTFTNYVRCVRDI